MNAEKRKLKITNSIMQKTFASAHILTISYKDEGKLHYFRVTTLFAGCPTSLLSPEHRICQKTCPFNGGYRLSLLDTIHQAFLLRLVKALPFLSEWCVFHKSSSQVRALPFLATDSHNLRLSVSGDKGKSFPVPRICLLNWLYNSLLKSICQQFFLILFLDIYIK